MNRAKAIDGRKWSVRRFHGVHAFQFTASERAVFRKRRPVRISEWAPKHRVLIKSAVPGPWRNEVTPHAVGIMDTIGHRAVREVYICKPPQSSGSESVLNCVGYFIDRSPGDVLYVFPDETTGKENYQDRLLPMIKSSRRLSSYRTGRQDDESQIRINLIHMTLYLGWSRSASSLANKPIRYVIFDETDKYVATSGTKESGPIQLGMARTITYPHTYKAIRISTPTTEDGTIWRSIKEDAEVLFVFWVVCPYCQRWVFMDFDHIRWPEGERDDKKIEAQRLAWYECNECGEKWDDYHRDLACQKGSWFQWIPREEGSVEPVRRGMPREKYLDTYRPAKVGIHYPSWISHFVSLSSIASRFLKSLKDKIALRDFMNKDKAEPWRDYSVERRVEALEKLKDQRPFGLVPKTGIAGLTAAIDTQDNGFWYEIRAWGFGLDQESWQVRAGFVEHFGSLFNILFENQYLDAANNRYIVQAAVIDTQGHRTAEIYDYCRLNRGRLIPLRGERQLVSPYVNSNIDTYPDSKKPIPGGIKLYRLSTKYYKDHLAAKLEIMAGDPGAWWFSSDTSVEWLDQLTSEYIDEKGIWTPRPGYEKRNHAWDVSAYQLFAADLVGIKFWNSVQVEEPEIAEPAIPEPEYESGGGWLEGGRRGSSWL